MEGEGWCKLLVPSRLFRVPLCMCQNSEHFKFKKKKLTMRRRLIGNIMVMRKLARPKRNTAGATHSRRREIVGKLCALVTKILLDKGLVVQGVDPTILVIGEEDQEVGLLIAMVRGAMTLVVDGEGAGFGVGGGLGGDDLGEGEEEEGGGRDCGQDGCGFHLLRDGKRRVVVKVKESRVDGERDS